MQNTRFSLMVLAAAGAVLSGNATAQVSSVSTRAGVAPATVGTYWTPQRMASARPVDVAAPSNAAATRQIAAPGASGAAGMVDGVWPTIKLPGDPPLKAAPPGMAARPFSTAPANTAAPADGAYPGPNATYEYYPKYRTFPLSTVGKLFFTEPGLGDYVCTATATYGGNTSVKNVIWTAGHCVANGGHATWYYNFLFCPSYDSSQGGPNPAVGCWAWTSASTTSGWFNNGSFSRDFAYITLASSGTVIHANVVDAVGGLGFAWNWARDQHWHHYGYPAGSPWSGGKLIETTTEHRYDDPADADGPGTNAWGSGQTPGSSGSSVILGFSYASGGSINSNVSFYYTSPINEYGIMLHGPYYDTSACNFWKGGTGWSGTC